MKKIKYIALLALITLFTNCNTNDDGFYNNVFVSIPNLVSIESHPSTYTVGEKLYINADFPIILTENGKPLDLLKTTGADEFVFSYVIEKKIDATTWEVVTVDDSQLNIIKGDAQNGIYVYGQCKLNADKTKYQYNVGFPLLAAGTYRLSFGYNSTSTTDVELQSYNTDTTRLILNISSLANGLDTSGYYNFTVN